MTVGSMYSQRCIECEFGIEHIRWYPRDTIPVDVREVVSKTSPKMMYKTKLFSLLSEILTLTKCGIYTRFQNQVKSACKIS